MKTVYLGLFTGIDSILAQFQILPREVKELDILLAYYNYEEYSGTAYVLFKKDGKYFEVQGSHCSCYGLENQWEPLEVTLESLLHRIHRGTLGVDPYYDNANTFKDELLNVLKYEDEFKVLNIKHQWDKIINS